MPLSKDEPVSGPIDLTREEMKSPLGPIILYLDERSVLRASNFEDREEHLVGLLRRRYGRLNLLPGARKSFAAHAIQAYFEGELDGIREIEVEPLGTAFQRSIWFRLREIEPGTTLSYSALAAGIGRPAAIRAAGAANGANPINLVIPCHRVIGSNSSLTGYGPGLSRKRWLLDHEGRQG